MTTTTATLISPSTAVIATSATPECTATSTNTECTTFQKNTLYTFNVTGITTWKCLDTTKCGKPYDINKLTATDAIPAAFSDATIWENESISFKGLSLDSVPNEVVVALKAGTFRQCIPWSLGVQIPTQFYNEFTQKYEAIPAANMPYMCGPDNAVLIKNASAAAKISVTDFKKLSATEQTANGAYDTTKTITLDPFNPLSGAYAPAFEANVQYPVGAVVVQGNRVYKCNSADCTKDPVADKTAKYWTFVKDERAPISSQVLIENLYDSTDYFYEGDFALQNGNWYTCVAINEKKELSSDVFISNDCNNTGAFPNAPHWRLVGDSATVNLTPPKIASPWSDAVDWQIGDFYADTTSKKVYQCTGGAKKDAYLCRTKYAPGTDQWLDVTNFNDAGVVDSTINNYSDKFAKYKATITVYEKWHTGKAYTKGDIVRLFGTDFGYYLCKGTTCSTTNPADCNSATAGTKSACELQWSKFDLANNDKNTDWTAYDVNPNNIREIQPVPYINWGGVVKCDLDIAATTATVGQTICDAAAASTSQANVHVCNKTAGCSSLTATAIRALPKLRKKGVVAQSEVTSFYTYDPASFYSAGHIVDQNGVFWELATFSPDESLFIAPDAAYNVDTWVKREDLKNTTAKTATAAPTVTAQLCVPWSAIYVFQLLYQLYLTDSSVFEIQDFGAYKLTSASATYVCDSKRVYKCLSATDCYFNDPESLPTIWQFESSKSPQPIADLSPNTVILGKTYTEWQYTPFLIGDITFVANGAAFDAYQCNAAAYQDYQCLKFAPTATGQTVWTKLDTAGALLIKIKSAASSHTRVGASAQNYGRKMAEGALIKWSTVFASKDTLYADFEFDEFQATASDDGYVFYCEIPTGCKTQNPASTDNTSWQILDNVIATSFAQIPILQKLECWEYVAKTPYMNGDVICGGQGVAIRIIDGFKSSSIDIFDYDFTVYDYLDPNAYLGVTVTNPTVYAEATAKEFKYLLTFNQATGAYTTVAAGTNVFLNGRIFKCISATDCHKYEPNTNDNVWRLTNLKGVLDTTQTLAAVPGTAPALPGCIADSMKAFSGAADTYAFTASTTLTVTNLQVCSTDAEEKRKFQASTIAFRNVGTTNYPYNISALKMALPDNWLDFVALARDPIITKAHVESAFASFPAFCNDPITGEDVRTSCLRDLVGFFTFLKINQKQKTFDFADPSISFTQTALDSIIDEDCYALENAAKNGFTAAELAGGNFNGKTDVICKQWAAAVNNPQAQFAEYPNAWYFARGPMPLPLIGARAYGEFSQVFFGKKQTLLQNPALVGDPRLALIVAVHSYMSYGIRDSDGPSVHDIFTGHWTPNADEVAAGLDAKKPVDAMLAVVMDILGQESCVYYENIMSPAETFNSYRTLTGLTTVFEPASLVLCTGVSKYPRGKGPNAGKWLAYNTTSSNCQLSTTPTKYHAYRSGDVKACMQDQASKLDYIASSKALESTTVFYTNWKAGVPYVAGSLVTYAAADISATVTTATCKQCKTGQSFACGTTKPLTTGTDSVWEACTGTGQVYYDEALRIPADTVHCYPWDKRASVLDDKSIYNNFVCHKDRVFQCVSAASADCLGAAEPNADTGETKWKVLPVNGLNQLAAQPELYCSVNDRFKSYDGTTAIVDISAATWTYDWSDLEFVYGAVCSFDKKKIENLQRGYYFAYNTVTGLTNEQLLLSTTCNGSAACTQDTFLDATKTKQEIWTAYKTALDALPTTTDAQKLTKTRYDTIGKDAAYVEGTQPFWQYATRTTNAKWSLVEFVGENWVSLPTRPKTTA